MSFINRRPAKWILSGFNAQKYFQMNRISESDVQPFWDVPCLRFLEFLPAPFRSTYRTRAPTHKKQVINHHKPPNTRHLQSNPNTFLREVASLAKSSAATPTPIENQDARREFALSKLSYQSKMYINVEQQLLHAWNAFH